MKFYHKDIELEVPDSVYYPREDSLLLAKILKNLRFREKKTLDMGCGSGFLAVLMAKDNAVAACDIDEEAIKSTEENARKNNVNISVLKSDLFSAIEEKFDIIVFNPPYLPDESDDKTYSGGRSGRDVIKKFIKEAKSHLNKNGKIFLLISSLTGEKEVVDLFERSGFKAGVIAREKIPWEELIVIEAYIF